MDATKLSEAALNTRRLVARQVAAEMGRHSRMSGRALAAASGVEYRTLMRCLAAERPFTVDELVHIAAALDVGLSALLISPSDDGYRTATGQSFSDSHDTEVPSLVGFMDELSRAA